MHVKTYRKREIIDITGKIERAIIKGSGILNIFVRHTTAAIAISDLSYGSDTDLAKAIELMTPDYKWSQSREPDHFPDHLWSTIIGSSISIPYDKNKLLLGKWQRIILIELDSAKDREIVLTFISTTAQPKQQQTLN